MRCYRLLIAMVWQALLMLVATPAHAAPTHIAAELVAESPAAPGQTIMLALHMKPEAGWHGYWSNPGDAGLEMTLKWRLTYGNSAGKPQYPVPQVLLVKGLMNHVFEGDYTVLVPLSVSRDAIPGTRLPVAVEADWLACTEEICVPERASLATQVSIVAPGTKVTPDPRFDLWRSALPAPLGAEAYFALAGDRIRIAIPLPDSVKLSAPHLFIAENKVVDYAALQSFSRGRNLLIAELPRAKFAAITPAAVSGVLRLEQEGKATGLAFSAAPGKVPSAGAPLARSDTAKAPGLPVLLLGALLGGLLLNIMPCVFPILSLKALSLARAGESQAQARSEGLAYTGGVVLACAALGALLLALRAAGQEVGWAFQLQEPLVVTALMLLAVTITANFLGTFEFAVPGFASEGSPKGAFATGLLAAFAATPCTGPFMAAAMGAALLLPVPQAMALFAALGLGIALPFLLIAFIPALRRRLPRPGAWMATFRRWMAVPMGLTALALLWLASRVGGTGFAAIAALLGLVLIQRLIDVGKAQRAGRPAGRSFAISLALLIVVGAVVLPRIVREPAAEGQGILPARPFSEAALARARASGKPVFAYFTADWCLTCKVNEQVAIERTDVRDAFKRSEVVVLRGDWTRRDPAITRFLTAQGVAGVPLYLWYPAGGGAPRQLPQVLAPASLIELSSSK